MHRTWNLVSGDSQALYPSWAQVKNYLTEDSVGEEKNPFFLSTHLWFIRWGLAD